MESDDLENSTGSGFFGVYLLYSVNPRFRGRTYIGFTVDPNRRIKQHNAGSHKGGALRTSGRGPWEMILIVHGFPSDIIALQFEWAWQHPNKSRRLKHVAKKKSRETSHAYCFRVLSEMLRVGPWNRLPLNIRWLKQEYKLEFPANVQPPQHMPIVHGPLYTKRPKKKGTAVEENVVASWRCSKCSRIIKSAEELLACPKPDCSMKGHMTCLAKSFLQDRGENSVFCLPLEGDCSVCGQSLLWRDLLRHNNNPVESQSETDNHHWSAALSKVNPDPEQF